MRQHRACLPAGVAVVLAVAAPLALGQPEQPSAHYEQEARSDKCSVVLIVDQAELTIPFERIEAGVFGMGLRAHGPDRLKPLLQRGVEAVLWESVISDEGPVRETAITKPFYLARYKTTVDEYCAFLNDTTDPERFIVFNKWARVVLADGRYEPHPGAERMPINTVPWEGAVAYCEWLSDRTGGTIRLPTEAEWEFAARGPEGRYYAWGDTHLVREHRGCIRGDDRPDWAFECTVDCGEWSATPDGVCGMLGPTREWVADWYQEEYDPLDDVDPTGPSNGYYRDMNERCGTDRQYRVLRADDAHASSRAMGLVGVEGVRSGTKGFRILMEVPAATPESVELSD